MTNAMNRCNPLVFFYGSFINLDVLGEVGISPEPGAIETGSLTGFDIVADPLASLVPSDDSVVWGILVRVGHTKLDELYGQPWVGSYLPEAVLVRRRGGAFVPAMTYISPVSGKPAAAGDYIGRIVDGAKQAGFPAWYIARLEQLREG